MSKIERIQPRTLKGFRDYLPDAMMAREWLIDAARRVYRSYGFRPIDTPVLEYLEILTGKGGAETDKQLYHFVDHGKRAVGMRFDLTVPLARFAAQHIGTLGTPFKRYHIAPVWRGENTQRGRYREFMQCDFDTIGTTSVAADIEAILVIHGLFLELGIEQFTIHVNNRLVLSGLLEKLGLADQTTAVLRALDKLPKIGRAKVADEMAAAGVTPDQAEAVLKLADIEGDNDQTLAQLADLVEGSETGSDGAAKLTECLAAVRAAGVPEKRIRIAPMIARGLDYYTGTVFETFLDELPEIGSVCSGGRYDNLAGLYTKEPLPGIGGSLGLDRLLTALETLGVLENRITPTQVFIPYFSADHLGNYLALAAQLRSQGFSVEVYPDPKRLGPQLKYADRRGFPVALIAGSDEFADNRVQVKNLATGERQSVSTADGEAALVEVLRRAISS